jgi:hypothetical protein
VDSHGNIIYEIMSKEIKRRNLSGIFIFDILPGDEKRQPTCFEDCTEEKQDEWLESLSPEAVKSLSKQLAKTLRTIGDQFDIIAGYEEEE